MTRAFKAERVFGLAIARAACELRLLGLLLAANLALALVLSVPVLIPAMGVWGHSTLGRGEAFPSAAVWLQMGQVFSRRAAGFFAGGVVVSAVGSFAVHFLLSGGIADRAWSGGPFRLSVFLRSSGELLGRNLRLFFWSILGLAVAGGLIGGAAFGLNALKLKTLFTVKSPVWLNGDPWSPSVLGHLALAALLLGLWRASVDLARVALVATGDRRTRWVAWRALRAMVVSPTALLGYCALSFAGLLAVGLAIRLHAGIPIARTSQVWLALVAAQGVIVVRLIFPVAGYFYAAEIQRRAPPPKPAPVDPPAPQPEPVPEASVPAPAV